MTPGTDLAQSNQNSIPRTLYSHHGQDSTVLALTDQTEISEN